MADNLIYIEWCDAIGTQEVSWMTLEEAKEFADNQDWITHEVGYLIEENDKYLLIASKKGIHHNNITTYGGIMKIPTTWIVKRIDLTEHIESNN